MLYGGNINEPHRRQSSTCDTSHKVVPGIRRLAVLCPPRRLPPLNCTIVERYNERPAMVGRLAYGSAATAALLWFWHGDMLMIRAMMAAVTRSAFCSIDSTRRKSDDSYLQFRSAGRRSTAANKPPCVAAHSWSPASASRNEVHCWRGAVVYCEAEEWIEIVRNY